MSSYWSKYWEGRMHGEHHYQTEHWFQKCAQEHMFHIGKQAGKQRVLVDIGCGAAELTVYYAPFFEKIYGVDFSSSMLQAAQKRIDKFNIRNIELVEVDACNYADKIEKADVIISTQVAQYLTYEQISKHLDESLKILNPKGSIFIFWLIDPKIEWLWGIGYLSEPKVRFHKLAFMLLLRELITVYRKIKGLPGTSHIGYSHRKERIKEICELKNLRVEFCNALYFEYRYNALINLKHPARLS